MNPPTSRTRYYREGVRTAILETFAWNVSRTARDTLRIIGDVALATYPDLRAISLTLDERPSRPVDLYELALEGDSLFVGRDEPIGMVEVEITRATAAGT